MFASTACDVGFGIDVQVVDLAWLHSRYFCSSPADQYILELRERGCQPGALVSGNARIKLLRYYTGTMVYPVALLAFAGVLSACSNYSITAVCSPPTDIAHCLASLCRHSQQDNTSSV